MVFGALIAGLCVLAFTIAGSFRSARGPHPTDPGPEFRSESLPEPGRTVLLQDALGGGMARARFRSNGHDALVGQITNLGEQRIVLQIPESTVFEAGDSQLVSARRTTLDLAAGLDLETEIPCVASRSQNARIMQPYLAVGGSVSQLAVLLPYVQKQPELPLPAVQTAVLVLTENLPLSAFAKFDLIAGGSPATPEDERFKAETRHIIQALQLLRDIGVSQNRIALCVDPQLQIEAMIDPLAHAAALKYFNIPADKEWAWWQDLLLRGPPPLRHYALFGIARYYPEVGLQMLPKWARAGHLPESTRISAIRSLADHPRPEVLPVLQHMAWETSNPAIREAVEKSISVVSQLLYNPLRLPVDFRLTQPPQRPHPEVLESASP